MTAEKPLKFFFDKNADDKIYYYSHMIFKKENSNMSFSPLSPLSPLSSFGSLSPFGSPSPRNDSPCVRTDRIGDRGASDMLTDRINDRSVGLFDQIGASDSERSCDDYFLELEGFGCTSPLSSPQKRAARVEEDIAIVKLGGEWDSSAGKLIKTFSMPSATELLDVETLRNAGISAGTTMRLEKMEAVRVESNHIIYYILKEDGDRSGYLLRVPGINFSSSLVKTRRCILDDIDASQRLKGLEGSHGFRVITFENTTSGDGFQIVRKIPISIKPFQWGGDRRLEGLPGEASNILRQALEMLKYMVADDTEINDFYPRNYCVDNDGVLVNIDPSTTQEGDRYMNIASYLESEQGWIQKNKYVRAWFSKELSEANPAVWKKIEEAIISRNKG